MKRSWFEVTTYMYVHDSRIYFSLKTLINTIKTSYHTSSKYNCFYDCNNTYKVHDICT